MGTQDAGSDRKLEVSSSREGLSAGEGGANRPSAPLLSDPSEGPAALFASGRALRRGALASGWANRVGR